MKTYTLLKLHNKAAGIIELIHKAEKYQSHAKDNLRAAENYDEPKDWHKAPAWIVIKGKDAAMREQRQEIAKYDAIIERLERYYYSTLDKICNLRTAN